MKIIWNEEKTAPEAPFFAAPKSPEPPIEAAEAWFQAASDFESEDDGEEEKEAFSWRGQGFGS